MERIDRVRRQLDAVAALKSFKRLMGLPYRELSKMLGLPESVLSRYVTGDILPSVQTAEAMLGKLMGELGVATALRSIVRVVDGYINLNELVNRPEVLSLYSVHVGMTFGDADVTRVLTAAVDGVPLAVAAAMRLEVPLVVAKQHREPWPHKYFEESYIGGNPPRLVTLYVSADSLRDDDRVLIIDDIVRTGKTLGALARLVRSAGASVVGSSVLISLIDPPDVGFPVDVVLRL